MKLLLDTQALLWWLGDFAELGKAARSAMPGLHRDPFDRLLIAQAQVERLTVVTSDPVFARYHVPVLST